MIILRSKAKALVSFGGWFFQAEAQKIMNSFVIFCHQIEQAVLTPANK